MPLQYKHSRDDAELIVRPHLRVPTTEFEFRFDRSSGPGGQNVNKVSSKATLRWAVEQSTSLPEGVKERFLKRWRRRITKDGDLLISSERFRDQARNVGDCLDKLRDMVEAVVESPKQRKKTKPSRGAKERRLKAKKQQSQRKQLRKSPRMPD